MTNDKQRPLTRADLDKARLDDDENGSVTLDPNSVESLFDALATERAAVAALDAQLVDMRAKRDSAETTLKLWNALLCVGDEYRGLFALTEYGVQNAWHSSGAKRDELALRARAEAAEAERDALRERAEAAEAQRAVDKQTVDAAARLNGELRERAEKAPRIWDCPDCAFAFDSFHTNSDGSLSCPVCETEQLRAELATVRAERDEHMEARAASEFVDVPQLRAQLAESNAARDRLAGREMAWRDGAEFVAREWDAANMRKYDCPSSGVENAVEALEGLLANVDSAARTLLDRERAKTRNEAESATRGACVLLLGGDPAKLDVSAAIAEHDGRLIERAAKLVEGTTVQGCEDRDRPSQVWHDNGEATLRAAAAVRSLLATPARGEGDAP